MKTKRTPKSADLSRCEPCPCCGEVPETLHPLPAGWSADAENLWCPLWDFEISPELHLGVIQPEDVQAAVDLLES